MITEQKTNRLIHSSSPYLLQHAHNPVDWYEWSSEAWDKAKAEDKPVLVSIGYSSCHWCHVMERESFENEDVAVIMNENFVCIKVDREERPDIDQIYMDAVHALGVQGGWPLNVFVTPDQKPFFGGTYFSTDLWKQVLTNINLAFHKQRERLEETAEELSKHLQRNEIAGLESTGAPADLKNDLQTIYSGLDKKFDKEWGGIDKAPKFVMPAVWLWLLRYYHLTQDESALLQLNLTLKRIAHGGIYDQIGGGFARYSVDAYWFAPHFEKMLYDNAQLLSLYAEAYAITKDEEYKAVVYETFDWLQREMTSDGGGFYSALDADSEGEEGRFYTWTKKAFEQTLGEDAELFCDYYNVSDTGNWEHGTNILNRGKSDEVFLTEQQIDKAVWEETLRRAKKTLLRERNKRIAPGLDDKILAGWNAMMICGLTDAYKAFDDKRFLKAAILNMQFLENEMMEGTTIYRAFREKRGSVTGFLDDYAYVIQSQIKLYEVTFDEYWIRRAESFMTHAIENFFDKNDGLFFYTSDQSEALISRKKEIFDNVIPSSNSVMSWNLVRLGTILDRDDWKSMATAMTSQLARLILSEPYYMGNWACVYTEIHKGLAEVAFVGNNIETLRQEFHIEYLPFAQAMGSESESELPLLADKKVVGKKPTIYVCLNKTCLPPVHSVLDATRKISELS